MSEIYRGLWISDENQNGWCRVYLIDHHPVKPKRGKALRLGYYNRFVEALKSAVKTEIDLIYNSNGVYLSPKQRKLLGFVV